MLEFIPTPDMSFLQHLTPKGYFPVDTGSPCVSIYEIAELAELAKKYKVLTFSAPNRDWLDFVFANRNGSYTEESYDIILESIANDMIYRTFIAYEEGILSKE